MDSIIFDCSLFQDEYPLLAQAVARRCQEISFDGINNVQIPYAQAVAFAGGRGKTYRYMNDLADGFDLANEEAKRNVHIQELTKYMTSSKSFMVFYNRLKRIDTMMNLNAGMVNRVKYGLLDS